MTFTHDITGPDCPVPFTLTPKAHAALDGPAAAVLTAAALFGPTPGEWGCGRCGGAWFGIPPGDGLCPGCRDHG
jgi:hypothetical protein